MSNQSDIEQQALKILEQTLNSAPLYQEKPLEHQVEIVVDNSVELGKFKPHPKLAHIWYAHAQTFRAMKKDLFASEHSETVSDEVECQSCSQKLDLQYWNLCPYCLKEL